MPSAGPRPRFARIRFRYAALGLLVLSGSAPGKAETDAGELYRLDCASCHGETGMGDGPLAGALLTPPTDFTEGPFLFDTDGDGITGTPGDFLAVIREGTAAFGGDPLMAPFRGTITLEEGERLVAFLFREFVPDEDGDGIPAVDDNCPFVSNDQGDADGDGIGDDCECGDANGDGLVDSRDARAIQRCAIGLVPCAALCDASGDGNCDSADARRVQRFAVGALSKEDLSCAQRAGFP